MQGSSSTTGRVVTGKGMCARWVQHPGSYPASSAPEVSIAEVLPFDFFRLRWKLTDQDKQSVDNGGNRCLFTEVCCSVHTCPPCSQILLETHKAEVMSGFVAGGVFCCAVVVLYDFELFGFTVQGATHRLHVVNYFQPLLGLLLSPLFHIVLYQADLGLLWLQGCNRAGAQHTACILL